MQVLIDNLDGLGKIDYTSCVQFGTEAAIVRTLNKPTLCTIPVAVGIGLPMPALKGRVEIIDCFGSFLFTGYVNGRPEVCIGSGQEQVPLVLALVSAVSDDISLDPTVSTTNATLLSQSAQQNWATLAALSSLTLPLVLSEQLSSSSRLLVDIGARWSHTAGTFADATRSTYRCIAQSVKVAPLGQTIYPIPADDPGLHFKPVTMSNLHWLANDITVIGREEPKAYVTEIFQGDGSTISFALSQKPFAPTANQRVSIQDLFQGTSLNPQLWITLDPGAHIALTAGGLTCAGGTGREAESSVASLQHIELGGVVTLEGSGVQIATGSSGTILALYTDKINRANCFAGFEVIGSDNGTNVYPVIYGVKSGSSFQLVQGHLYSFRLRVFSPEMERVRQSYHYQAQSGPSSCGGETVDSGGVLEFEVQDTTSGAAGAPIVLYSGTVSSIPPACILGLLDSGNLVCSIKSVQCKQSGPLLITVGASGSTPNIQFVGTAPEGAACRVTTAGLLEFYPNSVPSAGSLIYAAYRSSGRAVSRRVAATGTSDITSPTAMWVGTVTRPETWSSVDCDNAASALMGMASSSSVALRGTFVGSNFLGTRDIWPGDVLQIGPLPDGTSSSIVVRKVDIALHGSAPGLPLYTAHFANDWAESLSIQVSSIVPNDTLIPLQPTAVFYALENLSGFVVTSVSQGQIGITIGASAPVNGGFEVRRRDNTFGPGIDSDLVLRTATSNFSIPRSAAIEQYYVRLYDGETPPNYSLFSSAVFINVPL